MSPAFHYSEEIHKPFHLNGDTLLEGKRGSMQSNGSIFSDDSLSSSPREHQSILSITGKSSKTDFLNKIKYFERRNDEGHSDSKPHLKTDNSDHHTFRRTIDEVRSHFPKEDYTHLPKPDSKITSIHKDQPRKIRSPVPIPRRKFLEQQKENITKHETKKKTIQLPPVVKENENNTKSKKPVRELSIRETVNEVRSRFAEKNLVDVRRTSSLNTDYMNSNCAQFFSTSDSKFLPEETKHDRKLHFLVILKGILYDNAFYSLKDINQRAHYYFIDSYEYDMLDLDMFDPWAL